MAAAAFCVKFAFDSGVDLVNTAKDLNNTLSAAAVPTVKIVASSAITVFAPFKVFPQSFKKGRKSLVDSICLKNNKRLNPELEQKVTQVRGYIENPKTIKQDIHNARPFGNRAQKSHLRGIQIEIRKTGALSANHQPRTVNTNNKPAKLPQPPSQQKASINAQLPPEKLATVYKFPSENQPQVSSQSYTPQEL